MTDQLPQKLLTLPIPANEMERLAALHRYKVLDTPPEAAFDRITRLAAQIFNMPTALISLVDESRAWFKSWVGFGAREVPRDATLCSFAVLTDQPLIIPDARLDDRFACNPFVQSEPGVRFYAGAPLLSHDGFNLGTLCLLDSQPRDHLSIEQQATLVDLAAIVVDELELRLAAHKIAQVDTALLEITQGVATVTGGDFFDALVQHFAKALDVDYVYIGLIEGDDPKLIRTLTTCAHGQIVDTLEYPLQDTPYWEVIQQRQICCYPRNVQAHFPNAPLLKPLLIESYIAAPFFDSNGTVLGLLGVMDGEPLENVQLAESLLTIFANRIATELKRQQAEAALRESEAKYRTLFESLDEGFCICEMLFDENGNPHDYRFLEVNPVFAKLTGLEKAVGKTARELIPNLEAYWVEIYGSVVQTGEPVRFEQQSLAMNRWFDVNAFCIDEPQSHQFAILFTNISERKQAEQERERFFAVGSDLQVITGSNGYFQWVSPTFERILGWTQNEMTSHPWSEFVHPDDINTSVLEAASLFSGSETFSFENRYRHKDGSYRWFLWNAQLHPEEQVIYGAAIDITERKLAEESLRQSEERTRLAIAVAQLGTWYYDLDTNLVELDERMREIWGKSKDTVKIDLPQVIEQIHPNDRARVELAVGAALDPGSLGTYEIEYRIVWDDGSERWISANGQAQFKGEGESRRAIQFIGTALDITERVRVEDERKQAETALRQSEERFRALISASSNGLYRMSADWREMQEFHGGNFIADTLEPSRDWLQKYIYSDDQARVLEAINVAIQTKSLFELEHRVRRVDGTIGWTYSRAVPLLNPAGEIIEWFGEVSNITDRKRIEIEREQILHREQIARETAEQANRVKDEFLAVLSHELRSPLNPILGWARLLQNGKLDAARQAEALKTIERNAKLQSQLIEDLLDISRIMQGKLTLTAAPVNLMFVISAAVETVRLAAEAKNIQILLDLDTIIAPISGDAARLQQVVWNLLNNAVKFTPNGGQVTVELRQLEHLAHIRVVDTGKGIHLNFLPYVFEYFRQEDGSTTRKFGGLGLGLAIVRQIVELHGGTVTAESQGENQGATFTVQLPTMQQTIPLIPELTHAPASSEMLLDNIQILLVDDDPDTCEFQAFLLEQNGAKVIAVASGLEALQALEQLIPDVIVSDIGMAEIDGYMLMQQIRSRPPTQGGTIPAIALTAYAAEVDQQRAIGAGFQTFITKPVEPEGLIRAIITLLERNQP
jgi:PAS domain S-box-containing protein